MKKQVHRQITLNEPWDFMSLIPDPSRGIPEWSFATIEDLDIC